MIYFLIHSCCINDRFLSRWLNSSLTRHLQFAFRFLIAFLFSSLISYQTQLKDHLSSMIFMIPNLTLILIQETFGLTLLTIIELILILLPLTFVLSILEQFNWNSPMNSLIYLFLCLIISYQCRQIVTRKLCLLFLCLSFVNMINKQTMKQFQLLCIFSIGMLFSLIISLFIFPLFARIDMANRFHYCLIQLEDMSQLLIQAFLSEDQLSAKIFLSRANILEKLIRQTLIIAQSRFAEINYEPRRFFERKRRFILDFNLQDQEDFICSFLHHLTCLQFIIQQCSFNHYHQQCVTELKSSLLNLSISQSFLIRTLTSDSSITRQHLYKHLTNLQITFNTFHSTYLKLRRRHHHHQFDNHLSQTCVLVQFHSMVRLLTQVILSHPKKTNKRRCSSWRESFQFDWSRFIQALKIMISIAVGSIFVLIPSLAKQFEHGQWILIAICMTQGDTVGGAFTTMKMRLIGTLFGSMWAYLTYLFVGDDIFRTILMHCPWIFACGYLKLYPQWCYTVTVAASTPIVVNLGRLPFASSIPAGNYALLRIQQNVLGISIALILALLIVPVFAIDLLKDNIHSTFQLCQNNIQSILSLSKKLFNQNNDVNSIDLSHFDDQRRCFDRSMNDQRTLIVYASIEPSCQWINQGFSTSRYRMLLEQQIDIYRMLYQINLSLFHFNDLNQEYRCVYSSNEFSLGDFINEFHSLSERLNTCLQIWSSYFDFTQTKSYQIYRGTILDRKHSREFHQNQFEQCFIDLHQMILSLQYKQQNNNKTDSFQKYSQEKVAEHYRTDKIQLHLIDLTRSSIYYSMIQLANAAFTLGTTIHDMFELETTDRYQSF